MRRRFFAVAVAARQQQDDRSDRPYRFHSFIGSLVRPTETQAQPPLRQAQVATDCVTSPKVMGSLGRRPEPVATVGLQMSFPMIATRAKALNSLIDSKIADLSSG